MKNSIFPSFIFLLILMFNISCSKSGKYIKTEGLIWNTAYHITYEGSPSLQDSILPVLNEVSQSLSVFDKNSLVSRLNSIDKIEADQHLKSVYLASLRIYELSERRFDPTLSPLIDAWGFGRGHTPNADTLAIDSLLKFVGLDKSIIIGDTIIKKDIRTRFNFSAIAKGYGCDAVGDMFKRNGVNNFMVEIGGEITLNGESPSGSDWNIAIDAPVENQNPGENTALVISLTDVGIATSGNYRNFKMINGKKAVHTISPETGRPYFGEILSATVIAENCMEADAIATACMAGNLDQAKRLLSDTGTEGLLILSDSLWMSPGFTKYVTSEF